MFSITPDELSAKLKALDHQIEENDSAIPKLSNNFMWLINGGAGSGKTTLLLRLLQISHKQGGLAKFYKKIFLISGTLGLDPKLDDLCEELGDQCYNELNDNNIDDIMTRIKEDEDFDKEHYLVIFDDCLSEVKKASQSKVNSLVIKRRHLHTSIIFLSQKYNGVPTLWRQNCNLISMFASGNKREVESFLEDINVDLDLGRELYHFCTDEKHSFMSVKLGQGKPVFYKQFSKINL